MENKICTKCGKELSVIDFSKGSGKFGLSSWCKQCCSEYKKQYYVRNKEKILEQIKEYQKTHKGKEVKRAAQKKYCESEKGKIYQKEYQEEYYESERGRAVLTKYRQSEKGIEVLKKANKKYQQTEKFKETQKKYNQTEKGKGARKRANKKRYEQNKLSYCVSIMIGKSLKGNKASKHWETLVPYTLEDLKQYLENLFQPGMVWENHTLDGWHIDHKIPISSFNITSYDCEDFKKCWALENLQPLWAEENLRKHDKLDWKTNKKQESYLTNNERVIIL